MGRKKALKQDLKNFENRKNLDENFRIHRILEHIDIRIAGGIWNW